MIARVVRLTVWLGVGAVLLSGVYWLFLSTPETNALALGTSVVLLLLLLVLTALVVNAAVLIGARCECRRVNRQGVARHAVVHR